MGYGTIMGIILIIVRRICGKKGINGDLTRTGEGINSRIGDIIGYDDNMGILQGYNVWCPEQWC